MNFEQIETNIALENIVKEHAEHLERLTAFSVRGLLTPVQFITELRKMQNKTLSRGLAKLSDYDKLQAIIELEKVEKWNKLN